MMACGALFGFLLLWEYGTVWLRDARPYQEMSCLHVSQGMKQFSAGTEEDSSFLGNDDFKCRGCSSPDDAEKIKHICGQNYDKPKI